MPQADTLFIGRLPPGDVAGPLPRRRRRDHRRREAPSADAVDRLGECGSPRSLRSNAPAGSTVPIDRCRRCSRSRRAKSRRRRARRRVGRHGRTRRTLCQQRLAAEAKFSRFILNTLSYFGEASTSGGSMSVEPGHSITLHATGSTDTLDLRTPDGKTLPLKRERGESFEFSGTDELGVLRRDQSRAQPGSGTLPSTCSIAPKATSSRAPACRLDQPRSRRDQLAGGPTRAVEATFTGGPRRFVP